MKKEEFLEILCAELERLENVEHVSSFANDGRYEEIDIIIYKIDYSSLIEYKRSGQFERIDICDIPDQYILTFAIYLSGSEYDEIDVMGNYIDLSNALRKCGVVGEALAKTLIRYNINMFKTFAELISRRAS